jgi:hypothetical protein
MLCEDEKEIGVYNRKQVSRLTETAYELMSLCHFTVNFYRIDTTERSTMDGVEDDT